MKKGMLNIGLNPTFNGSEITGKFIEVNIFDFSSDIYGASLTMEFYDRIRDEKKFPSAQDLIAQLKNDESLIRKILDEKG